MTSVSGDSELIVTDIDVVEETVVDEAKSQTIDDEESTGHQPSCDESLPCFVAVHIGAGFHSQNRTGAYRLLCEQICSSVIGLLKQGCKAREAAATACALLENSPLTNAGLGSNLTLDEKIECDASIMDKDGYGSVGAVSNVKNPIMVALSLLDAQSKGTLSMGRIVPCMLVGNGARQWAHENRIEEVDDEFLKTDSMKKSFFYYKKKLDNLNNEQYQIEQENHLNQRESQTCVHASSSEQTFASPSSNILFDKSELKSADESRSLDTVGAIALDTNGNFSSAISSGGILLKLPGRVGHASFFGCGCWVEESEPEIFDSSSIDNDHLLVENEADSIAICTTGCGEYIIKTLFAKKCADHILSNKKKVNYDLNEFFTKSFFNSPLIKNSPDKLIGALICKLQKLQTSDQNEKRL